MANYLDFEKPLAELEEKIQQLSEISLANDMDVSPSLALLYGQVAEAREKIFANLTAWQRVQLARHPDRPYPQDYIGRMFTDFLELSGDRRFAEDKAIIGGFAKLDGKPVMVIGTRKGRDLKSNVEANFGCAHPEGYRKALRLMMMAEKARIPIICLVDTPGAFPGIASEERHIGEAIAVNLREMFNLTVPVVVVITGEGGSGGALGLGIGNKVLIMENAYYSVITPEGCAAILWRDGKATPQAAEALRLTSQELLAYNIVDGIVPEPPSGAHRDHEKAAALLSEAIQTALAEYAGFSTQQLKDQRYARFRKMGVFKE
jgi:acetyl-CoA carboxylase carboxyl transferase subunit alpha